MKKLLKPLMAVVLLIGVLTNSVEAQTPSNDITTSSDRDMTDDSGKWGLLGLLGFLGLIKWNKNNNHNTGTYTTTPQNR